jgi:hypothetical protein
MEAQDDSTVPVTLSKEEAALVADFRKCDPRRKEVVRRFAHKLGKLEHPRKTNVVQFRRRKDD